MRTLIIPDLHNHTENADHWLMSERHDRVVFLGDFCDDFEDTAGDARLTALWLRNLMDESDPDTAVFLLGNHDAAYLFPERPELYCPGFTKAKSRVIQETLSLSHWTRFRLAHAEQGWLLSHAGFHSVWIVHPTLERIFERCEQAMEKARRGILDPVLGDGEVRGGIQRIGGPLGMDWGNLVPIPGLHQIVGHTPGTAVRKRITTSSRNYCLDVRNGEVAAIIEDGELEILEKKRP